MRELPLVSRGCRCSARKIASLSVSRRLPRGLRNPKTHSLTHSLARSLAHSLALTQARPRTTDALTPSPPYQAAEGAGGPAGRAGGGRLWSVLGRGRERAAPAGLGPAAPRRRRHVGPPGRLEEGAGDGQGASSRPGAAPPRDLGLPSTHEGRPPADGDRAVGAHRDTGRLTRARAPGVRWSTPRAGRRCTAGTSRRCSRARSPARRSRSRGVRPPPPARPPVRAHNVGRRIGLGGAGH